MSEGTFFLPTHVINDTNPILSLSEVNTNWGFSKLKIDSIHKSGYTGKGVRVGIIDTAADFEHPDLNLYESINVTMECFKKYNGHGTACAGIIGANGTMVGVAPDCEIVSIKAMREDGSGDIDEIVKGFEVALSCEVDILNVSLGTTMDDERIRKVIEKANELGVYVVCAAGNTGQNDSVMYPAKYKSTFACGASNEQGYVSAFSSRGSQIDIVAPGERILTTWKDGGYSKVSGTSFAAPFVSGCFALFLQAIKELNIKTPITHKILHTTATDIEEPGRDDKSGYGLINPLEIVRYFTNLRTLTDNTFEMTSEELKQVKQALVTLNSIFFNKV